MPWLRWSLALLGGGAMAAAPATSGGWKLPPVDGEVSGEFNPLALGGAPPLTWKLGVRTQKPRERTITFSVEGPGALVRGEAQLDPAGEGTWRITESRVDLAEWLGWIGQLKPELAGVSGSGTLKATGEGTWRGGVMGGRASFSLRDGRIDDPARKFLLEGISVDVDVDDLAEWRTAPAQIFTWRSGRYDVVPLGVGRIEFAMDREQVRITSSLIDVFGGELQVGSLVMSTQRPEFSVNARMVGIAVDQVLFLLPQVLSEAQGKLDGDVALQRDSTGIQIGNCRLALRAGETADLRLAIKPGWLSTSLPPEIVKYFPGFRKIETGEIPIRAHVLEITLTPLGDAQGRTGWVHVAGGSNDPELTAPLDLNVDLHGPLDELMKMGAQLGTDSRLRFSGAR